MTVATPPPLVAGEGQARARRLAALLARSEDAPLDELAMDELHALSTSAEGNDFLDVLDEDGLRLMLRAAVDGGGPAPRRRAIATQTYLRFKFRGQWEAALEATQAGLQVAQDSEDASEVRRAQALRLVASAHTLDYAATLGYYRQALTEAEQAGDRATVVMLQSSLVRLLLVTGREFDAVQLAQRARALLEQCSDAQSHWPALAARLHTLLALGLLRLGRADEAKSSIDAAFEAPQDSWSIDATRQYLGFRHTVALQIAIARDDPHAINEHLRAVSELARLLPCPSLLARREICEACVAIKSGRELIGVEKLYTIFRSVGPNSLHWSDAVEILDRTLRTLGRYAEAASLRDEQMAIRRRDAIARLATMVHHENQSLNPIGVSSFSVQ